MTKTLHSAWSFGSGTGRGLNPKSEIRNLNEIRSPKPEKSSHDVRNRRFEIRISDFRPSVAL